MPRELVFMALNSLYTDELSRDQIIAALSKMFEVSGKAMEYRLMNLGLIHPADD
jgi:Zn-dependent peptidase ImmA (M78 family)